MSPINKKSHTTRYLNQVIRRFTKINGAAGWIHKELLHYGLVNQKGKLTNAGALFSDQCPIRNSRIFCTRWNGITKRSIFDDKEFSGSLIYLLDSATNFIKNNSKKSWRKTSNGRIEKPDYAERAVFEAVVNGIIHRDYLVQGSEGHIDMYDDIKEILEFCGAARTRNEIQEFCGIKSRDYFRKNILNPLLENGKLKRTLSDKPNSKNQKYIKEK